MSSASPSDLAIAFRSLPRRLREAQADTPSELTSDAHQAVNALVAEAAMLLSCPSDANAVADAIERVPANQWQPSVLARLGAIALELGGWVRRIAAIDDAD